MPIPNQFEAHRQPKGKQVKQEETRDPAYIAMEIFDQIKVEMNKSATMHKPGTRLSMKLEGAYTSATIREVTTLLADYGASHGVRFDRERESIFFFIKL